MKLEKLFRGFTLLELTIVVIIIALLILLALPQFMRAIERGRKSVAHAMIDAYRKAEGIYFAVNDKYIISDGDIAGLIAEVPELAHPDDYFTYTLFGIDDQSWVITAKRTGGGFLNNTIVYDSSTGNVEYSPGYDF